MWTSTLQMQDIIAILILRKLSKFCDEYNSMIIKDFWYILVNFINLKVHLISYNIHNTPCQVLNFRPKSTGEPPEDSTCKKTQRKQHHTNTQGTEAKSMKTLQTNM